jgi:hypothetical protein
MGAHNLCLAPWGLAHGKDCSLPWAMEKAHDKEDTMIFMFLLLCINVLMDVKITIN